jgi:hypothetical protein
VGKDRLSDRDLNGLLAEAAAADAGTRIEFRDPIAAHGEAAVHAIEPWLMDVRLGAFAIRVLERAASYGARDAAVRALRKAATATGPSPAILADASAALQHLVPKSRSPKSASGARTRSGAKAGSASPEDLVVGRIYKRRELHLQGYGGNWQSGISYPADGTYVLLFSDQGTGREHGYHDRWMGDEYLYYGQWTGTGDMVFEVGNRAILDRSNDLHLLVAVPGGHRYEGRFRLVRDETARTVRDGREWTAIVFVLAPAGRPGIG